MFFPDSNVSTPKAYILGVFNSVINGQKLMTFKNELSQRRKYYSIRCIAKYILVVYFLSSLGVPFMHPPVSRSSKHITMFSSKIKYKSI